MAAGKGPGHFGSVKVNSRMADLRERVTALYEAYRDPIYRFLVGQGLNPAIAQEVTQDVFVDLFVTLEKTDTQLVYNILKTLYSHLKPDLVAVHKDAEKINLQTMTVGSSIPFHPGAVKFYAEKGIKVQ